LELAVKSLERTSLASFQILEEGEAELAEHGGSIWIRAEGGSSSGSAFTMADAIAFSEKELDKLAVGSACQIRRQG